MIGFVSPENMAENGRPSNQMYSLSVLSPYFVTSIEKKIE